ncbi:MAG TPA: flagellar motor protein MotA, partial [Vicinamibacteria bacterium]
MQVDLAAMVHHMGVVAWGLVAILTVMAVYSFSVMIERAWDYSVAAKQSRQYAPEVVHHLKQGQVQEAIDASYRADVRRSHLAKVLAAGLQE